MLSRASLLLPSSSLAAAARPHAGVVVATRSLSKYVSKTKAKFLPLHRKHAKKGYYKGTGCRSTGRLTSKGKFIVDKAKLVEFVVPDLTDFSLKPYVARSVDHEKFPMPKDLIAAAEAGEGTSSTKRGFFSS